MHFFCHQKNLWKKFCRKNGFCVLFVAKTIYALCLESFWALKVAIWTVQSFWASACPLEKHAAPLRPTNQPPSPAPIKVQNCMAHAERKWHMAQRTNARNTYIFLRKTLFHLNDEKKSLIFGRFSYLKAKLSKKCHWKISFTNFLFLHSIFSLP